VETYQNHWTGNSTSTKQMDSKIATLSNLVCTSNFITIICNRIGFSFLGGRAPQVKILLDRSASVEKHWQSFTHGLVGQVTLKNLEFLDIFGVHKIKEKNYL